MLCLLHLSLLEHSRCGFWSVFKIRHPRFHHTEIHTHPFLDFVNLDSGIFGMMVQDYRTSLE
jgi:hypothetical protein